jgi:hypothetical protein
MHCVASRGLALALACGPILVAAGFPDSLAAQQPRVAFVTSVLGDGNLSTWPDSDAEVGAMAGDAICRNRAAAAGLDNAANFVAWLSTTTDDAYCRIHGLGGKKAANCGQAELPVEAGPWVRSDGLPFTESIDRLLVPESLVYYPLEVGEFGNLVETERSTFTMTGDDGSLNSLFTTCSDWTDNSNENTKGGVIYYGSEGWTVANTGRCDFSARLYCFETASGPALNPPNAIGALSFVTSVHGNGDLGSWADAGGDIGIDAADTICRARAAAAGLDHPSSFQAWISDSSTDAIDRFQDLGPRVRPDGVRIADSIADLTDGKLDAALNVNEFGTYVGNQTAWTSTTASGVLAPDACVDWTSSSDTNTGGAGSVWNSISSWTLVFVFDCNRSSRLYCIADPEPLFVDGFESGDVSAWSETVP